VLIAALSDPVRAFDVTPGSGRPGIRNTSDGGRLAALPRLVGMTLPRTVQLCIHCRENPAGFWVIAKGGKTARRPWCLSCCGTLDRSCGHVIPFDR
jgi:hypothetical protein